MEDYSPEQNTEKKRGFRWYHGCGIGCGAVLLVVIVLAFIVGGWVKESANAFKITRDTLAELATKFGPVDAFIPDLQEPFLKARIELFLEVRESLSPRMKETEQAFLALDDKENMGEKGKESILDVFRVIKKASGAVPRIAEYLTERNRMLLKTGMSLGEYYFYYSMIYYSWLSNDPGAGIDFDFRNADPNQSPFHFSIGDREENQGEWGKRLSGRQTGEIRLGIQTIIVPMIRRWAVKIKELEENSGIVDLKTILTEELERLDSDPYRIPWQDHFPPLFESVLSPYRGRFSAAYSKMLNSLEFSMNIR